MTPMLLDSVTGENGEGEGEQKIAVLGLFIFVCVRIEFVYD